MKEEYSNTDMYQETDAPFNLEVGTAVNLMDFRIDGHLNPDFLFDGPDFVGGNGSGTFGGVSVLYNFSGM